MNMSNILRKTYLKTLQEVDARKLTLTSLEVHDRDRETDVVAVGKAAPLMALAARDYLKDSLGKGFLLTKNEHLTEKQRNELGEAFECREAGHPVPDEAGLEAGSRLMSWLEERGHNSRQLLVLLSGGASSLLVCPADPLSLNDLMELNQALLKSGLPIETINILRKHVSRAKGGQLASHASDYHSVQQHLMVDIVAPQLDPEQVLSLVGSGPFTADSSTVDDASKVLDKIDLSDSLREKINKALHETPEEVRTQSHVVGSHKTLLQAARSLLENELLERPDWEETITGEVRTVAGRIAQIARQLRAEGRHGVLVAAGEPVVEIKVSDPGRGGRCQELALHFAKAVAGMENVEFLAGSSDGTDGPTREAGARVDGDTWPAVCHHLGEAQAEQTLFRHDSGFALSLVNNALLDTGPTGQNLNDLYLLRVGPVASR
jgi:hydroxypyruvate reductase